MHPLLVGERERSLIIIVDDTLLDPADFLEIAARIRSMAPHIYIWLGNVRSTADRVPPRLWRSPTLTIGVGTMLGAFAPLRGDILSNKRITKLDQYAILVSKGVATPRTERFVPGKRYDVDKWGEHVLLKPAALQLTGYGLHVRLLRTRRLNDLTTAAHLRQFMDSDAPFLVQDFIDTGPHATAWRVLTLFGEPLYCLRSWSPVERPALDVSDADLESAVVVSKHLDFKKTHALSEVLSLERDEEIIAFASTVASAFPRIPLLGVDILREAGSGALYALEVNAGGNVWHFSSSQSALGRTAIGKEERIAQLGAWDRAARAFIKACSLYAR